MLLPLLQLFKKVLRFGKRVVGQQESLEEHHIFKEGKPKIYMLK